MFCVIRIRRQFMTVTVSTVVESKALITETVREAVSPSDMKLSCPHQATQTPNKCMMDARGTKKSIFLCFSGHADAEQFDCQKRGAMSTFMCEDNQDMAQRYCKRNNADSHRVVRKTTTASNQLHGGGACKERVQHKRADSVKGGTSVTRLHVPVQRARTRRDQ